jgi:hypothetical protein
VLPHCFWDYEAERAFEQAVRLDPDCAMCHWGLFKALDFSGHHDQPKAELARAKDLDHPELAIESAEKLGKLAPESGHVE